MRPALLAAAVLASTALVSTAPAIAQVGLAMPQPVPMPDAVPTARDIPYPGTIRLDIDASDTSRGIYRVVETIPVRPGPLTLLYPQWLPGNHGPSGPIASLAGLRYTNRSFSKIASSPIKSAPSSKPSSVPMILSKKSRLGGTFK